ncbi:unnamed protein product [Hymenolepis diminuta]|uniref:Uncharacterized protein n=1 Tax=Hymenolepis diminuta TaxID=6216 RepID=A0A564YDG2_HYMDI|nr:unnamed protein product [Hymenolepis diminuta]
MILTAISIAGEIFGGVITHLHLFVPYLGIVYYICSGICVCCCALAEKLRRNIAAKEAEYS